MKGTNHLLAVTTQADEVTGEVKPLFAFPVQVCKAVDDDDKGASFDLAAPSGGEYETKYVDLTTGETFESSDKLKGVRLGDEFRAIDAEALKAIDEATKIKTMVCLGKLPVATMHERYCDRVSGRYFLQCPAKGGSPAAYRLLKDALKAEGMALVTKRTPTSRQKLNVIYTDEQRDCLVMLEVAFAAKVREPDEQVLAPNQATVTAAMVAKARKVVKGLPDGTKALEAEVDEAIAMRAELIEKAIAGEAIPVPTPVATTTATEDLAGMLEASLA